MFKQITNFNKFNIYIGKYLDFDFKQNSNEFKNDSFVAKIKENDLGFNKVNNIFNKVIEEVTEKNVYIITDKEMIFLEIWQKCLIKYLN